MKRNLIHVNSHRVRIVGLALLSVALMAGPGLAAPVYAVPPAMSEVNAGRTQQNPSSPAPDTPTTDDRNAAMAAAIGAGGAEMGQRSPRVTSSASASGTDAKRLSAEALSTEGTWSPTFGIKGLDVSGHQASVDWQQQWNMGAKFAYVKATEGNYYVNEAYSSQYQGSRNVGMVRGAYHFAIPNWSSGADQARYFVRNGGGWTADGWTMPPVLDFEFNPYAGRTINGFNFGNTCYGMSPAQLTSWVRDFGNTMRSLTGRLPAIYTNTSWWKQCLGDPTGFGDYPLWVAAYPSTPTNNAGSIPASWSTYSIWQYSSTGPFAGDSNVWNGTLEQLKAFARAGSSSGGAIERKWIAMGGATGSLGAATTSVDNCNLINGGCYRTYANGTIYWNAATGAFPVTGSFWTAWGDAGWQKAIGYPTGDVTCPYGDPASTTCHQAFEGGIAYRTPGVGTHVVTTAYLAGWKEAGWQDGLGYPTAPVTCGLYGNGCYQPFTKGNLYWTAATGAHAVTGAYWTGWKDAGWQQGLGYPTGPVTCGLYGNGCYQPFAKGNLYWSEANGAYAVTGAYWTGWKDAGWQEGLGYPTGPVTCGLYGNGCYQPFTKGNIYWSPTTGAHAVTGAYWIGWQEAGFQPAIGYPTGPVTCGLYGNGCYQPFTKGNIYWSPTTGAHAVTGAYWTGWQEAGFQPAIGYPTGPVTCGLYGNGCYQPFAKGNVYWSATTGAHAVTGAYWTGWQEAGFQPAIGYPTGPVTCGLYGNGCYQPFAKGNIYWSATTGAHAVTEPYMSAWRSAGWQKGNLGYPTSAAVAYRGYRTVYFQGGSMTWTTSGVTVR
ncbi:lysozyme M1 [Arthrobacter sp. FW305-BF8]|uniref:GH25 family lysozyme n=1 Tax=Arthrobacter sp. FW305-BF8 TaxID=2879617 RepID=UPI001F1C0185|nr:GH25 family lysozyme [Arthrobacter sp. FW305-BF8]UKA52936.1 lysozyme M1 [Arthrobacter sp. FW305-BF8]